jgi:hypothetical protein
MHDGAWFAVALVNASRATGDPYYRDLLTRWILPFYCRMLNHSGHAVHREAGDVAEKGVRFGREHQLQEGEKGFVPTGGTTARRSASSGAGRKTRRRRSRARSTRGKAESANSSSTAGRTAVPTTKARTWA